MTIDDVFTREDMIKIAQEARDDSEKYKDATDAVGHQIYMCKKYASDYIIYKCGISDNELSFYKKDTKQLYLDLLDGSD
jgi:hypothetical protein